MARTRTSAGGPGRAGAPSVPAGAGATAALRFMNRRLSVLRGLAVSDLGDLSDVGTPLYTGIPGAIAEITETVFDFPGSGRWGVQAAQQLDVPGVLGSTMLAAFLFVMANLISDILYAVVDPRIRVGN